MVEVDAVCLHGIFDAEDDIEFASALALWGGRCMPAAEAVLAARWKVPCLLRGLEVSRFGGVSAPLRFYFTPTQCRPPIPP